MIVKVIGGISLFLAVFSFIGAWRNNLAGLSSATDIRDFCLFLIAAAICFK